MEKNFIVIAEFFLKPGTMEEFIGFAMEDSEKSLANEEGCLNFDVLVPRNKKNVVILYEIYKSRDAFDTHRTMPHYQPFKDGTNPLLAKEPNVQFLNTI